MYNYGYNATCAPPEPSLSGRFFGLGAALTPAQRRAQTLARQQAAKQARTAKQTATKAKQAAKKAVKVAGKTVLTSSPNAAASINAAMVAAQNQLKNVMTLTTKARGTRSKADIQAALAAAHSAGTFINTLGTQGTPSATAQKLRGMGYMGNIGSCTTDPSTGQETDDGDGYGCADIGVPATNTAGGVQQPYSTGLPYAPTLPGYSTGLNTGLVPGFGLPSYGAGIAPAGCRAGSNLPRCLIYSMAQEEQQQFQFVFTTLQQMYAQLLQIVQQLMSQLQSAQQSPYAYGQSPYGSPYGASPYGASPYDPSNPYSQYGAGYGGQYGSPYGGYSGAPYYAGGDSSQIPAGYDGGGDGSVPSDVSQIFPGPSPSGAGYPMESYGGPPPGLISSDSLPDGADPTSGSNGSDDAAGLIPTPGSSAYLPTTGAVSSGPNMPVPVAAVPVSQSTAAPVAAQPQIIVLNTGPGQQPYADAGLPAGDKQNQPTLDPPEHDDSGLTGWY